MSVDGLHPDTMIVNGSESEWKGPFYFVHGSDPQFGLIERYIEKKEVFGWEKEKALARLCVEKINQLRPKPKFFIICGDMVDAMPDWKERREQESDFWEIFGAVDPDIPLMCVCGNHDVGDQPTAAAVQKYRSTFGDDFYSFWVGGVLFIVLNSQYLFDPTKTPDQAAEQEAWLDKLLKEAAPKSRHGAVIVQHIPWFISDPEDKKEAYFALPYEVRKPWLDKLYDAGVRQVFAGHLHYNVESSYRDLTEVVSSAIGGQLGSDQPGFRIVKVGEDSITHTYHPFEEVPTQVTL